MPHNHTPSLEAMPCRRGYSDVPTMHAVLQHGDKIISDSSAIFQHLHATFPDTMALFTPADAKTYANLRLPLCLPRNVHTAT